MNVTTMKEWFFDILKKTDLYYQFLEDFGDGDTEDSCCAEYGHLQGWYFTEDSISYRSEDLFDLHSDGWNWRFADDDLEWVLKQILLSHGFEVEFEGGDEEDGLFVMRKSQSTV